MGVPSASDFIKWDGSKKFDNTDWGHNVDKIVEITADGNYDLNVNKITAAEYVGVPSDQFTTLNAGENLTAGNILRVSGGQLFKADNTSLAGIASVVGVCNTTVSSGNPVKVDYGFYGAFSALTVGTLYYVGTGGGITSTKPDNSLEIGYAVSATRINLEFKEDRTGDVRDNITFYDVKKYYPRSDAVTIGASYTNVYSAEGTVEQAWTNNLAIQNNIKMLLRFTGGASSPSTLQAKLVKYDGGWNDVWESNTFDVYNPGSFDYNDFIFDLHSGNSTNLDIYTTPLSGINLQGGSWKIQVLSSGITPRLHEIQFYWMK